MRSAAVLFLLLATSSTCYAIEKPKTTNLNKMERVLIYASAEFDAATTYHGINSCPQGLTCREANPMMRSLAGNPAVFPVMAGSAWVVDYLSGKLSRDHRKLSRVMRWISIAGHMAAGINNVNLRR